MDDYPGNSHKEKNKKEERKKVKKVTSSNVRFKNKTFGRKFSETFFNNSLDGVISYVVQEVLIPYAKDTIYDAMTNGLDFLMYGTERKKSSNKKSPYVSYTKYYDDRNERRKISEKSRRTHNFEETLFESRWDAQEVLDGMLDILEDQRFVTVADYYDLCGIAPEFTDENYGWTNLRTAEVRKERNGGFSIRLPKTEYID